MVGDGDVQAAIAAGMPDTGIDVLLGVGGSPEGVIAAAALRCIGGGFQGRLVFRNDEEKKRAKQMGITDLDRKYDIEDLAKGPVMFSATGVTSGSMLRGVQYHGWGATTHSMVMRSMSGTIRFIETQHNFKTKPMS
jgi:fructose-1,6-bisphosphatase/sedoheptulose 1,7-bisphosphatase-like protein